MKPSNSSQQDLSLIKVPVSISEEPLVFFNKVRKENYNNKITSIIVKNQSIQKILTYLMTSSNLSLKNLTLKYLFKTVSKIFKNLFNFKMINKKSLFGFLNFFSSMKLLIRQQEHYKKSKINVLNSQKFNFGLIFITVNSMSVDKLEI